jgi:hypothetical protein
VAIIVVVAVVAALIVTSKNCNLPILGIPDDSRFCKNLVDGRPLSARKKFKQSDVLTFKFLLLSLIHLTYLLKVKQPSFRVFVSY